MRSIAESSGTSRATAGGRGGRSSWSTAILVISALAAAPAGAQAQDVTPEYAETVLAPAAIEMANAGVDGSAESMATMIEIAQRYGFGYGISPDEVRLLLGGGYLAVRQIDCRSLTDAMYASQRLSRVLSALAWAYAAGAGMAIGAPPVAAALGFGALITGIAATTATWLAADFRERRSQVKCTEGGSIEWFRRVAPRIQAAADPARWRSSWPRSSGASALSSCRG